MHKCFHWLCLTAILVLTDAVGAQDIGLAGEQVNLAAWPGVTLTASSGDASVLADRLTTRFWTSGGGDAPRWLQMDAGDAGATFMRVRLAGAMPIAAKINYMPTGIEISIGDDPDDTSKHQVVATVTDQPGPVIDVRFEPTRGRYLRVRLLGDRPYFEVGSLSVFAIDPKPMRTDYPLSESGSSGARIDPLRGWWHGWDSRGGVNLLSAIKVCDFYLMPDDQPVAVRVDGEDAVARITLAQPCTLSKLRLGMSPRPEFMPGRVKLELSLDDIDYHTVVDVAVDPTIAKEGVLEQTWSADGGRGDARYARLTIARDDKQAWKFLHRLELYGSPQPSPRAVAGEADPSQRVIGHIETPAGTALSAAVYDATGRIVRTLHRLEPVAATARRPLHWDGRDDFGQAVAPGSYTWRALTSSIEAKALPAVGNSGEPSHGDSNASTWATGLAFDHEGNLYQTNSWDESGKAVRSWDAELRPRWSFNHNGVYGVAVDQQYAYVVQADLGGELRTQHLFRFKLGGGVPVQWPDHKNGIELNTPAPYPRPAEGTRHLVAEQYLHMVGVTGVAVDEQVVWLCNYRENRVDGYDKATGAKAAHFAVQQPRGIAVDAQGKLWVAHSGSRVTRFNRAGQVEADLPPLQQPGALAIGGPRADLYVNEHGTGQIHCYDAQTLTRRWSRGRMQQAGPVSDDSFRWSGGSAIAVDAQGGYIVADPWNQRVQYFHADGSLRRSFKADFAQPGPFVDPSVDPGIVISGRYQYRVDLDSGDWTFTHNWLMPDERFMTGVALRRRLGNGRDYLYYLNTSHWGPMAYLLSSGGDALRRSASLGTLWTGVDDNQDHQWKPRPFVWRDANADGALQEPEVDFTALAEPVNYFVWRSWIDEQGDFWFYNVTSKQVEVAPLLGFDEHDNPRYDWNQRRVVIRKEQMDNGYEGLLRIEPGKDGAIWLAGIPPWVGQHRKTAGLYHQGGFAIAGFDRGGQRRSEWSTVMEMESFTVDGTFVYVAHNPDPQVTDVYEPGGLLVARIIPGHEFGYTRGWMDTAAPLTAFKRPGTSTHHLLTEDIVYNRLMHWRFDDAPQKRPVTQGTVTVP